MNWDQQIDAFWEQADDRQPEVTLEQMRTLVEQRPAGDPDAQYEWASVHDFLGREEEAIPLYERAIAAGLAGERLPQAQIQLASSLRNVGRTAEAISLLGAIPQNDVTGDAAQAFLSLTLFDEGRTREAVIVALSALAKTLPMYRGAVQRYAETLGESERSA